MRTYAGQEGGSSVARPESKRRWDRMHKTRSGNRPNAHAITIMRHNQMRAMRAQGYKVEEIADYFNVAYETVVNHTKDVKRG